MKELLIAALLIVLSTFIQNGTPGDSNPAALYLANTKVKEGQEVQFKCHVTDMRTIKVYVHVCKNAGSVKTSELEKSEDDRTFVLDKVTVEDSGLYSCVYSTEKRDACKMNVKGHNSISLEVHGEIFPAKISGTQRSLREGDNLTLICSISVNKNCTEVYVHLCLNGIGTSSKLVKCDTGLISATFFLGNINQEHSGKYSCVYSISNYTFKATGGNTIYIEVHDYQWEINLIRILVSIGVIIFACMIIVFDIKTR